MAVTGRSRKAFAGGPARGFESHRLRHNLSENPYPQWFSDFSLPGNPEEIHAFSVFI